MGREQSTLTTLAHAQSHDASGAGQASPLGWWIRAFPRAACPLHTPLDLGSHSLPTPQADAALCTWTSVPSVAHMHTGRPPLLLSTGTDPRTQSRYEWRSLCTESLHRCAASVLTQLTHWSPFPPRGGVPPGGT